MESQSNENNSNLPGYENQDKLLKLNLQNIKNRHSNTFIIRNINKIKIKRPISSYNYSINKKLYQSLNDENNKFEINNKLGDNSYLNLKENIFFNAFDDNNSNLLKHSIEFNNKYKEQSKIIRDYFSDNKIEKNNNKVKLEKLNIRNSINLRYNNNQNHFFSYFEKINFIKNKNIFSNRNPKYSSLSTKNMTKQRTALDNQDKIKCKSSKNINKPNIPLYKERKIKSSDNLIYSNNLIEYKEVVCNSPEIPFNINYYKKKDYNNLIRIRNKQKNNKEKRYSFYKYKEYMDKIENEKIEIFKKEQEKIKMVNIQTIFNEIPNKNKKNQRTNKNEIKNLEINYEIKEDKNNNDKNLLINNLNNNLKEDEHQNNIKILNNNLKDDEHQSDIKIDKKNEGKIIIKKTPKKNKINVNKKFINALKKNNSLHKVIPVIHKKKKNKEKDEYESSYSEPDITINNFFYSKTNLSKIGKKDINSGKKIINFNKNKKYEKNIFNLEEPLISNDIKNDVNISNDDFNIEMLNDKDLIDLKDKIGDSEAYELLKKKYFKNKERMMMMNKKNIKAQKKLFKKIIESDKDHKLKRPSQLEPFLNLKYKYTDEEINIYKQKFYNKYYEKNKNNFTPTKSRERLNSINSMNSNLNQNNTKQYYSPPPKNIEENNEIIIKENGNIEEPHNNKDDKIDDDNINTDKKDNDKLVGDIIKNYTDNDDYDNNGTIINNRENINLKKKKNKNNNNIIKEKGYLKNFIEQFINNRKKGVDDGGKIKEEISEKVIEEVNYKFKNLIHENEKIINSTSRKEEAELFLEFKEKMISLERYSKKEFNLYLIRNYKYILKILEDCKRDKEREERIDKFLKAMNEDLKINGMYKSELWQDIKVIDYQPFISYNKNQK